MLVFCTDIFVTVVVCGNNDIYTIQENYIQKNNTKLFTQVFRCPIEASTQQH